jgi:hypothetical protein
LNDIDAFNASADKYEEFAEMPFWQEYIDYFKLEPLKRPMLVD